MQSKTLTREEFTSLLIVGNTCAVLEPPAVIPFKHRARLIALGYMADLSGRLRMTTSGRALQREAASATAPRRKREVLPVSKTAHKTAQLTPIATRRTILACPPKAKEWNIESRKVPGRGPELDAVREGRRLRREFNIALKAKDFREAASLLIEHMESISGSPPFTKRRSKQRCTKLN